MKKYVAIRVSDDAEEIAHISVHGTYGEALEELKQWMESSWADDLDACFNDDGDIWRDLGTQEEDEDAQLHHDEVVWKLNTYGDWTLEDIRDWSPGENDQRTVFIEEIDV